MNRRVFLVLLLAIPTTGVTLSALITPPAPAIVQPATPTPASTEVSYRPKQKGDVLGASTSNPPAPAPPTAVPTRTVTPKPAPVVPAVSQPAPPAAPEASPSMRNPTLESGFTYDPSRDVASTDQLLNTIKGGGNVPPTTIPSVGIIDVPKVGPPADATSCVTEYPDIWRTAPMDTITDDWQMYNRQSVSYTAFRVHQDYVCGKNTHDMPRNWKTLGVSSANNWDKAAVSSGLTVDALPAAGAIAVDEGPTNGFTMYVEKVNSDGSLVMSSYNFDGQGTYHQSVYSGAGQLKFIHF